MVKGRVTKSKKAANAVRPTTTLSVTWFEATPRCVGDEVTTVHDVGTLKLPLHAAARRSSASVTRFTAATAAQSLDGDVHDAGLSDDIIGALALPYAPRSKARKLPLDLPVPRAFDNKLGDCALNSVLTVRFFGVQALWQTAL